MFWMLGLTNARRNLQRSLMAIISMAMASGFMAYAFSFSRGYSSGLYTEPSVITGGEIVVYSTSFDGSSASEATSWQYRTYENLQNTDIDIFYPELVKDGFITTQEQSSFFTDAELQTLSEISNVTAVYPRYQIPAWSQTVHGKRGTSLRGRDEALDLKLRIHPSELIVSGRWFEPADEDQLVAVVAAQQHYLSGQPEASVGDVLSIALPTARLIQGKNYYDFSKLHTVELKVIGVIEVPTRILSWEGFEGSNMVWYSWKMKWLLDEIQLPLSTWRSIWQTMSLDEYCPEQASLVVDDTTDLEDIAAEARVLNPSRTVISLPQLMQKAERELLLEDPVLFAEYEKKAGVENLVSEASGQSGLARDLRLPLAMIIFATAGLVVASNLLLMLQERRREIGVLKSVGALRINIVQMILAEALFISMCGAAIGFTVFRIPASANQLSNGVRLYSVLLEFAANLSLALGAAGAVALLFGMIPAWLSADIKPQSLLQE